MGKSCLHGVHKSWMKRERSEANPSPPHAGTISDAKWSLPVMGELPAEKLWRWWLEESLYNFFFFTFLVKMRTWGEKKLFGSVNFPYVEKSDKMFCFSGALENGYGNQDHTHQAGIRDEDAPGRWAPRQLSSQPDCILHSQQKLNRV